MKLGYLSALLLSGALLCSGQNSPPPDPTLDATGMPAYMKLMAKPAAEPWSKITEKQRFDLYTSYTFSPMAVLSAAAAAGITQATNSPREWGQGWGGYGIRTGSSYGSGFLAFTITYGTSVIFKDDNRYFRSHSDKLKGRIEHVIISPFVAHSDSGQTRFSASSFLGDVGGAGIPLMWSPPSWQGWEHAGFNALVWYGGVAGTNLMREFYPTLVRHYRRKHDGSAPAATPSAGK